MPDFSNGVATPAGASYMAPLLNFQQFANWPDDYSRGVHNQQQTVANDQQAQTTAQQQQINQQRIQQGQQQLDLAGSFKQSGVPSDYMQLFNRFMQAGDYDDAMKLVPMIQQQQAGNTPLLPPQGGHGAPPQAASGPPASQPASVPARSLPAPAANSPQGDSGSGTLVSIVTAKLPEQNMTTGQTIMKIAEVMAKDGVPIDPNAQLTEAQQKRAKILLQKYAPEVAGGGAPAADSGTLPPSANAVSAAPKVTRTPPPAVAPAGGAAAAPAAPQGQPMPPPVQSQQPQGGPIVPQVPLPPDPRTGQPMTDPQAAAQMLRQRAAQIESANPKVKPKADELRDWATRIEGSIAPIKVSPNETIVDPRTGKPLYQGAGAAALANPPATLDADAERYRQTGTLPPNMGRGMQGEAQSKAIRARAAELEIQAGGDPAQWSTKWQDFKAAGVGKSTAERTKAGREENLNLILKAADAAIPAALEASRALPRGQYVPLNKLIQKGEIMSSDPRLVEFGMANLQLAEHWARAMNPTGVMRESDRDKALMFLDTGYSNNTYERAVMQLQKQITRERDAVRGGGTILKNDKAPDPGDTTATKGTTPGGVKWSVEP